MECSRTSTHFQAYSVQLRSAIRQVLPVSGLPLCSADQRVRWSDRMLLIGVLLMVWHPAASWREAFAAMREQVVAMYPTRRRPGVHLEGFLKAWRTRSARLLKQLVATLRARTQHSTAAWRWRGWVVLGVDGSRFNCPRTRANEQAFGCAGKQRTAPQQLLVTLFHIAGNLPWAWRATRGDGSERGVLLDMLPELPERTLLLADAGLAGYRVLTQLQAEGHAFIVRVGRNVTLLRKLGYHVRERAGIVYLWPGKHRSRPPLTLRLVTLRTGPRQRMALLTSVLDERRLSAADVAALYRRRWSLEVMHRTLKQTLGKGNLRAQTPELAACELDWSMAGLWMVGLMARNAAQPVAGPAADAARRAAQPPPPVSPAAALRVIRTAMRRGRSKAGKHWLQRQLRAAVPDRYRRTRPRKARDWPHKKSEAPPGTPKIRTANRTEIRTAKAWINKTTAA